MFRLTTKRAVSSLLPSATNALVITPAIQRPSYFSSSSKGKTFSQSKDKSVQDKRSENLEAPLSDKNREELEFTQNDLGVTTDKYDKIPSDADKYNRQADFNATSNTSTTYTTTSNNPSINPSVNMSNNAATKSSGVFASQSDVKSDSLLDKVTNFFKSDANTDANANINAEMTKEEVDPLKYQLDQINDPKNVVNPSTIKVSKDAKKIASGFKPGFDSGIGGDTTRDLNIADREDAIEDELQNKYPIDLNKDFSSKNLTTEREAVSDLVSRGYNETFDLKDDKIVLNRLQKSFDIHDIKLNEVHHFSSEEKATTFEDNSIIIFGIQASKDTETYKGVMRCKTDQFEKSKLGQFVSKMSDLIGHKARTQ